MDILDLGVQGAQHRERLEEVKRQVGVTHNHFDGWIYNFLENKRFDVPETVAKLHRRTDMERQDLATYQLTDDMLKDMRQGVIQLIGEDKEGRVTFYITTKRDFPKASQREVRRKVFDIWLSFGTRLRRENKRCRIAMLINQEDASMWSNTDMKFQSNIALRISKFYPGVVDKMYVCKMGRTLAALAQPIFAALPQVVSEHIFIVTDSEIKAGKLLQYYDPDVLPIPLGGRNNCDTKENWDKFADIISEYWARLSAGLAAGKSVKDWELEQIMAEEAAEKRRMGATLSTSQALGGSGPAALLGATTNTLHDDGMMKGSPDTASAVAAARSRSQLVSPSHDADTFDLHTCFSDEDELADMEDVMVDFNPQSSAHPVIIDPFARLEYFMGRARYDIEKEEDIYRVALLMLCGSEGKAIGERGEDFVEEAHTHVALKRIPAPFRGVTKGCLWLFCMCLSFYFFVATVFLAIVASAMIAQLFYAAFSDWYLVWPAGVTALLLGYHLTLLLSRGFGLVMTAFRGHVVHPLGQCGTFGFVAQMAVFIMVIIAQFIVFVYYAATKDPVTGARISFTSAWMACTIIICVFHLLFPLGVRENSVSNRDGPGSLSLYLFYDITEQENPPRTRRSAIAVSLIPVVVSLLFGIGFMASGLFFFIIATPIAVAATAVCVCFFARQRDKDFGAPIICANAWFLALMWAWVTIVGGTIDLDESRWVASVSVTCCVVGVLALLCLATVNIRTRRMYLYFVKFNYVLMLLLFITCVVVSYWMHWGFILIMLLLGAHLLLCTTQHHVTNLAGTTLGVIGPLVVFCSIILLAHIGIQDSYTSPRSYGPVIRPETIVNRNLRYPVCLNRFAANTTVTDLALFSEVVQASDNTTMDIDFNAWFPTYISKGLVAYEPAMATVYEFEAPNGELVFAFRSPRQQILGLLSLTMWTEAVSLYPIVFSIPKAWIPGLVDFFGWVTKLVDFPARDAMERLSDAVVARAAGRTVVLTGHGVGGAAAAVIAVRHGLYAVTYSSPALTISREKFDLSDNLESYLTEIKTSNDALGSIDTEAELLQSFKCEHGIMTCSNIRFLSRDLMRVCGDGDGRTHD